MDDGFGRAASVNDLLSWNFSAVQVCLAFYRSQCSFSIRCFSVRKRKGAEVAKYFMTSCPLTSVYMILPSSLYISRHQAQSGPGLVSLGQGWGPRVLVHPGFMFSISSCLVQWQDSTLLTTKTCPSCFLTYVHGRAERVSEWVNKSTKNGTFNAPGTFDDDFTGIRALLFIGSFSVRRYFGFSVNHIFSSLCIFFVLLVTICWYRSPPHPWQLMWSLAQCWFTWWGLAVYTQVNIFQVISCMQLHVSSRAKLNVVFTSDKLKSEVFAGFFCILFFSKNWFPLKFLGVCKCLLSM